MGRRSQLIRMDEPDENVSWKEWFQRFGPRLLLCARQWVGRKSDAEDIVQDAFVRYWRRQRTVAGDALPLVLISVRRAAFDLARKDGRRAGREDRAAREGEEGESWFESSVDSDDRRQALEAALRELPAEQREVVALRIWGELTFEQIAHQLAIPANTAASRYRYGLLALRKALAPTLGYE
jgi:RNA polymerase sigma-70 factor, ECF subfamily